MDPWSLTDSRVHIWYRLKKESRQIKYAVPDITLKLLIINHLKLLLLPYSTIWGAKIRFYILASVAKYVSNYVSTNLSKQVNNLEKHKLLKHSQMPTGPILKILVRWNIM